MNWIFLGGVFMIAMYVYMYSTYLIITAQKRACDLDNNVRYDKKQIVLLKSM